MSDKRLIEPEDLERLRRLSNAAGALLGHDNQRAEDALTHLSKYKDLFLSLSQRVSECNSKHQAQQQAVNGLESRLKQNQNDLAETTARLNRAVDESDVDSASLLNSRLPALQLVIDSLARKLEEARQQLDTRWLAFDTARSHVLDLRRRVDDESNSLEGLVQMVEHARIEEIRAHHREQLNASTETRPPAQSEEQKTIRLTRRSDELPIQVTRGSEP